MNGRSEVDQWMNLATENHTAVVKTYMYAVAFHSKGPKVMERYAEKQEDEDLLTFHQECEAGFTQSRVLEAERELFAFYDSLEKELGEHQWLVDDRFTLASRWIRPTATPSPCVGQFRVLPVSHADVTVRNARIIPGSGDNASNH